MPTPSPARTCVWVVILVSALSRWGRSPAPDRRGCGCVCSSSPSASAVGVDGRAVARAGAGGGVHLLRLRFGVHPLGSTQPVYPARIVVVVDIIVAGLVVGSRRRPARTSPPDDQPCGSIAMPWPARMLVVVFMDGCCGSGGWWRPAWTPPRGLSRWGRCACLRPRGPGCWCSWSFSGVGGWRRRPARAPPRGAGQPLGSRSGFAPARMPFCVFMGLPDGDDGTWPPPAGVPREGGPSRPAFHR